MLRALRVNTVTGKIPCAENTTLTVMPEPLQPNTGLQKAFTSPKDTGEKMGITDEEVAEAIPW